MHRVVITGIGLITPIGIGVDEFWQNCLRGTSGVDRITAFDPSPYTTQIAAELKDFDPTEYLPPELLTTTERVHQMGLVAALMALEHSGLDLQSEDRKRMGTYAGSGVGGLLLPLERLTAIYRQEKGETGVVVPRAKTLTDYVSDFLDIRGQTVMLSNACATGNHAIGWAFNSLRLGRTDVVLAGGAEAPVLPLINAGFCALRVMSRRNHDPKRASRPFDRERDGFVMGEGAAFLVLEELEHARRRGANIIAEVAGYSMTGEAYHMVMPSPEANEVANTMALALRDASLDLGEVDYINAHGTSTGRNDIGETQGIKGLFGSRAYDIPVSSTKSMIGHTIGAAGAIELVACALAIRDNIVPPTINYEVPDPECDLDYVPNEAREWNTKVVVSNSFGFGSNNSSIVLRGIEI